MPTRTKRGARKGGAEPEPLILFRIDGRARESLPALGMETPITELASKWQYVLRNRSRWLNDDWARATIVQELLEDLARLGLGDDLLGALDDGVSAHIELEFVRVVDARLANEAERAKRRRLEDAAAAFAWEFVLSVTTRALGRTNPLVVTRLLPAAGGRRVARAAVGRPMLFVQSAPGRLHGTYSFDTERARIEAATTRARAGRGGTTSARWRVSDNEILPRLVSRLGSLQPSAIHLSGIDNHQAAYLLPDLYGPEELGPKYPDGPPDGMIMQHSAVPTAAASGRLIAELPVNFETVAAALVPRAVGAPRLVTCNLYYSSTRLARELVRRGAGAALGFQDEVDDEIAEHFFHAFYREWARDPDGSLPRAFGAAWTRLREGGQPLFGTGIVLWLAESAFATNARVLPPSGGDEPVTPRPALPTAKELTAARARPIGDTLQVEVDVEDEINYSLLHNARPFLSQLTLTKLAEHPLDQVRVTVDLNAGEGTAPFRHTELLMSDLRIALAEHVRVPLTAPLLRSLRERVRSTLYVRVDWDGRIAHESTRAVTLLPVDEWLDDTQNNPWLASFVLPRDPAVARIIGHARRHLVTLKDDAAAGFDGYQSIDRDSEDPAESIDTQVQAIWSALLLDYRLLYINPPPAYSARHQRLRTPSDIVGTGAGTCIDLTLLLAACLELVDIHPVIVLLSGHAFVGYWRDGEDHDAFQRVAGVPKRIGLDVGPLSMRSRISLVDPYGWRLGPQNFLEIRDLLRTEKLRFLEATGLCFGYSFASALEEGSANLKVEEDFDSLIDIRLARTSSPPVTPLPIIEQTPVAVAVTGGARGGER